MNDDSLKAKIAALLAKAERTDNEHERDAFNAKAEALMLKYGVEQAELQAAGQVKADDIIQAVVEYGGIYAKIAGAFNATIVGAMGGLNVLQQPTWDKKGLRVYLIGHESDVQNAQIILASLHLQSQSAMKRWWKSAPERQFMTGMEGYKARRQFIVSFAEGAAHRIRSERTVAEETASAGAALVLVDKKAAVDEWMHDQHNVRSGGRNRMHGSMAGRAEGNMAGRQANVGGTGIGGGHRALNS